MTNTTAPTACTVHMATGLCGADAVTTFTGRDGTVYAECADHAPRTVDRPAPIDPARVTAATLGLRTATTRPYVLVRDGAVVGYADAPTAAVVARARRLRARIIPTR